MGPRDGQKAVLFVAVASVLILSGVRAGQRGLHLALYADTCTGAI